MEKLEQDYSDLCDRVEKIDAEAARYMRSDACLALSLHCQHHCLTGAFRWSATPQGSDFWARIAYELERSAK